MAVVCAYSTPNACSVLDVSSGAGNNMLKLLEWLSSLVRTLVDLSGQMLERAEARIAWRTASRLEAIQDEVREAGSGDERFAVILAAAVPHHLRGDEEWEASSRSRAAHLSRAEDLGQRPG